MPLKPMIKQQNGSEPCDRWSALFGSSQGSPTRRRYVWCWASPESMWGNKEHQNWSYVVYPISDSIVRKISRWRGLPESRHWQLRKSCQICPVCNCRELGMWFFTQIIRLGSFRPAQLLVPSWCSCRKPDCVTLRERCIVYESQSYDSPFQNADGEHQLLWGPGSLDSQGIVKPTCYACTHC